MSRQLVLKAALILFLSAGPSAACDPEEMINELRAQCRDAISSALTLIQPIKATMTPSETEMITAKSKEATALCSSDKYSEGYTLTAKLARYIGHLESQRGIAPAL